MNMAGPSDLGGSDSSSQQEERAINAIPAMRIEIRALSQRFDEHATRTERNFSRAFAKLDLTNGRVDKIELWKAELRGAKKAVGWLPPLFTAVAASSVSVLLAALFLH
jgi:hypothetical protein